MTQQILSALAERPYPADELAAVLQAPVREVYRELTALKKTNQVKKFGSPKRWALPDYRQRPGPVMPAEGYREAVRAAVLKAMPRTGIITTVELARLTGYSVTGIRKACTAAKMAKQIFAVDKGGDRWSIHVIDDHGASRESFLDQYDDVERQLDEFPLKQVVSATQGHSWWIGLDRTDLTAKSAELSKKMSASRMARKVNPLPRIFA